MRRAIPWIAVGVIALIVIGVITGNSRHSNAPASSAAVVTSTSAVSQPQPTHTVASKQKSTSGHTQTSGVPKSGRCGNITVNQHTSCAFARIVAGEYNANPSTGFQARSPITGLTYTMHCQRSAGVVACDDNSNSELAFNGPPPVSTSNAASSATSTSTDQSTEGPGSFTYAGDEQFCSAHGCIENFPNGNGYVVQSRDGEWSHSGGISGACSDHGGEE